jgi:hypothetical protein
MAKHTPGPWHVTASIGTAMDDLLKSLRALARGKHDDFSVAFEAADEIERLLGLVERMRGEAKEGLT